MLTAENFWEQALAQVFDGKAAGTCMMLDDIAVAWNDVGLRKSDLDDALRGMVERNHLVLHSDAGRPAFLLTERGAVHFYISLYCEATLPDRLQAQRQTQDERTTPERGQPLRNRRSVSR